MAREDLLEVCLESPTRQRSCGVLRRGTQASAAGSKEAAAKAKAKLKRPKSACGVCGRPPKQGVDLPFEWVKVYKEPSNPKLGWSRRSLKAEVKVPEKPPKTGQGPVEATAPRPSLPRRLSRVFQTVADVESRVDAWRRRVLGPCSLRQRQASVVDFVDNVLSYEHPKGDTLKFAEHLERTGSRSPKLSSKRTEPKQNLEMTWDEKMPTLELDMNTTFINPADRFNLNQIFGQLSVNGDLFVDRVAEALEVFEGKGSDKEWVREILKEHFPGRVYLERGDFIEFVNMYRRHRHAFMLKLFIEVDQDGSKSLSLEEIVVLLGRRGITPVMSCVERIFREVTGERELRDLSFDEFVQIYDVVQARAGFSEHDLARLRKVWSRYDQDGNQVLSADEVRLALDWQGFVVDCLDVESLVHEVGRRHGLNQHEFLTFMRKYRDLEVQKLIQTNEQIKMVDVGSEIVSLVDLPRALHGLGYEDVAPEVLQECAALVHLVNREMAVGITTLNPSFNFDGLYHFMENLRSSHGFINDERVDLTSAFNRFSNEQFLKSGFLLEEDSSEPEDCEDARLSVLKLFHALRWLGYQLELYQVVEKMDSIRMVGSATLCQEEFMRIMAVVHKQEIESIRKMLEEQEEDLRSKSDGHKEAEASVTPKRLKRIFQHLGYSLPTHEVISLCKEFGEGYYSQDVWGVAEVLRQHRKKVRELVRRNFGFHGAELQRLQHAFENMGARSDGKLKGKLLSNVVRELFPGAERDQQERSRAHEMLKQVTKCVGNCEELAFEEFVHLVRLRVDHAAEAKLEEEHRALQSLNFVPVEVAEFRIIFHKIAREEQSTASGSLLSKVSAVPVLSWVAVEAMVTGISGEATEMTREALQEILEKSDLEKKGSLYFCEFLQVVRSLMAENWHNINDEAQKLVFESWAEAEADALYHARIAEFARRQ